MSKNKGEWIDSINNLTDKLQNEADKKCEREVMYSKAYCEGYKKSAEDFRKQMVDLMYQELVKEGEDK